jgi:circadian clock protein KaiC
VTDRVKTGISELDEMLGGGFLREDSVLVVGSAGTGKTVLGLQYLVNGASRFSENGVFVTFEELPEQLYRDALNFGWDLRKLEHENKFRLICTSPDLMLEGSEDEHLLDEPIRQIRPKRIVVDSLGHLELCVRDSDFRKEAYRLIRYFKTKKLSAMLTWESHDITGANALTLTGLSFLADCVIPLRYVEIDSTMRKALTVLKLRGSDHDKRLREFDITSEGIKVAKPFRGFEGVITGSPRKTQVGTKPP